MVDIVSVRFKEGGKSYYFDPCGKKYRVGDSVIVETANGLAFGKVSAANRKIDNALVTSPLKAIIRMADERDFKRLEANQKRADEAIKVCEKKIEEHKLDMRLVEAEYAFDESKLTFFFISSKRVDFRELVRDLASTFRTRIELRQIGCRDEARMLGGIAICGQPFCCNQFLDDFQPVCIKMAKEQNLSLNPTKISGHCGRLMCCLKYEHETYEYLIKTTPSVGATVKSPEGTGVVTSANLLTGELVVSPEGEDVPSFKTNRERAKVISRRKRSNEKPNNNDDEK